VASLTSTRAPSCQSTFGFFQIVQQVEDLIRGRLQLANNLTIGGTLLALECASGIVDAAKTLGDLLTLHVTDPKDPSETSWLFFHSSSSWLTIAMPFPAGVRHHSACVTLADHTAKVARPLMSSLPTAFKPIAATTG
jgi:hypothetical protein